MPATHYLKDDIDPIVIGNDHIIEIQHITDADGAELDTSGWTEVTWFLRLTPRTTAALLAKSLTRSGTYSATPSSNTQKWTATLTDTETAALAAGVRAWAIKRMDDGSETDLAYGEIEVRQSASR